MANLRPLIDGGVLTAAVASQISDGAAALLIASQDAVNGNLTPRARTHHMSVRGADPVTMLTAPIPAIQQGLKRTGMSIDGIDTVEINEAFAPVVLDRTPHEGSSRRVSTGPPHLWLYRARSRFLTATHVHMSASASALRGRQRRIERFARPHHRRGHVAVRRVVAADVHRLALRLGEFLHDDVFVLGQRIGQCGEVFGSSWSSVCAASSCAQYMAR